VRLGGLINTKAMEAALPGSVLEGAEAARMTSIKPGLGPGVAAEWNGLAGQIAPQPRLADGTRLDDRVGYRFVALVQPDFAAGLPADTLGRLAEREVMVVADDAPEPQAWLQAADASAILVRPDRYVLGAVHSLQELNALATAI
jgi:3-(3-hydroxy-phenyl)propionate hydroxylase